MKKMTVRDILMKKRSSEKIVSLSTYDFPFAKLADESGADLILVGDSLGMVLLGNRDTLSVTMRDMVHHTKAVSRAVERALVIADMPFGSYQTVERAFRNAKRFLQEAHANGVKLEGGRSVIEQVKALVNAGIPVMGHVGMTPQSYLQFGGYKVQGRSSSEAGRILKDALLLEKAGAFSIVLECVPEALAKKITARLKIPTIGIGAGVQVDGQILVLHDILGFKSGVQPKFVRRYANLDGVIRRAIGKFKADVLEKKFPSREESFI